MININDLKYRKEPPKYTETMKKDEYCNVANTKKIKKYEYYVCDYCKDHIRLDKKKYERSGGIAIIPHSLSKCGELKLALCNKCVKDAVQEIERVVSK